MHRTPSWRRPFTLGLTLLPLAAALPAQIDPALFAGMKARSIGPAGMSGRIADVEVVVSNPKVMYVGTSTGGVWKSTNAGISWVPVFDTMRTSSVGAVAVFQPNPDIVWVGTGEGNPRNSAGVGYGIWKSLDGGTSWQFLGLERTEHIHRVLTHPGDENVAYVCAMGTFWGANPERGVYKTTDGGKTWSRILFVNERSGCADLVMDPANPNKLLAATWEFRRWPWFMQSGGPGSGIHVTYDGGASWKRLTDREGLPKGDLGRIGLAIAASTPDVVYALVEATRSALLRSDDGGRSFRVVNDTAGIANRPFYYTDIRVDPTNENRVYNLFSGLTVSEDGGRTFRPQNRSGLHGDHHDLWIHPDGELLVLAHDGGLGISNDKGRTWRFVENLPLGQYYHVNVDLETPYNVYGGLQDNGSWRGPSAVWEQGGIRNYHWDRVGGGDGFGTLSVPGDARYGYAMSQGGNLRRFDLLTGESKDIRPVSPDEKVELRFNWNAAIAQDPFDANTIYYGSQFVHKSPDRGDTWTTISPDLTTNDPEKQRQRESGGLTRDVTGAENHTTIVTIAPSARDRNVIWVGTDDGNVQLTRDAGRTWVNVGRNIRGVPPGTWVPHVEASTHDAGTAFVVFDDHRRANWTTYVYRTTDYGRSWTSLATPEIWGFAHVIEQDPVNPDLLFLGTEFGLYVSLNAGRNWFRWTHGLPTAPAAALMVHPRDHDLVIGTHGRSVYILDDIRPLRTATAAILARPVHVFEIPAAYQYRLRPQRGYSSTGDVPFEGENRPYGALVTYSVNPGSDTGRVEIEVLDSTGAVVRRLDGPARRGINRVSWNLRRDPFRGAPPGGFGGGFGGGGQGPEVVPGTYTVRVKSGDQTASQTVQVLPDPRYPAAALAGRLQNYEAILQVGRRIEVAGEAADRLRRTIRGVTSVEEAARQKGDSAARALATAAAGLKAKLQDVLDSLVNPPGPPPQAGPQPGPVVLSRLTGVLFSLSSSWDPPTEGQRTNLRRAEAALQRELDRMNRLFAEDVDQFRRQAAGVSLDPVPSFEPLTLDWRPAPGQGRRPTRAPRSGAPASGSGSPPPARRTRFRRCSAGTRPAGR
ncbi:MAG TPA: hypothetical protein VNI61_09835 [Gemmatimonadales bacterium]|nr:hypothetical protein [Gemmatimonadales bacterium]